MIKWIASLSFLYVVGAIVCGMVEQSINYTSGSYGTITQLVTGYQDIQLSWNIFSTMGSIIHVGWDYIVTLFHIFMWDYPTLFPIDSPLIIIRAILMTLSVGIIAAMIWSATRGTNVG